MTRTLDSLAAGIPETLTFGFIPHIGPQEMIILLVLALLLFGRRLPEVGRALGKGIVEFKRGVKGMEDEIEAESNRPPPSEQKKSVENKALTENAAPATPGTVAQAPSESVEQRPAAEGPDAQTT